MVQRCLRVERLGTVPYDAAMRLQARRHAQVCAQAADDTLFLLEHPPVVTTGRHAGLQHLRISAEALAAQGVDLVTADRGGDVTYHGPGQLVGYPIVALQGVERDLRVYVTHLEEILIRTAADFGVTATRVPGLRGIWVGRDKLAAIGVRLAQWVTSHGFALNIDVDLGGFDLIVPCGLPGRGVTSLTRAGGKAPQRQQVEQSLVAHTAEILQRHAYNAPSPVSEGWQADAAGAIRNKS